jgi:hypothetical protein
MILHPATVVSGAQHGRKWSRPSHGEATRQDARCHEGRADASEREYERELLLDEFDLINAYKQVAEAAPLRTNSRLFDKAETERFFQRAQSHKISMVPENYEEFAHRALW